MNDTNIDLNQQTSKEEMRVQMLARRDAVPAEQRTAWSQRIFERAVALPLYQSAQTVHVFLSIQSEIHMEPLIEHALAHGKRVVLPVFLKSTTETPCTQITSLAEDDFKITGFGLRVPKVRRPVPLAEVDWVWVPLLAFWPVALGEHLDCGPMHRLGYGAGFYDRFLAQVQVPKVGLAFEMQRISALPVEPHDVPLDFVVTEGKH